MSKNDVNTKGLPPIPESVDGPHNEVFLTYRDLGRRYRRCRRTIVRWTEKGILPKPVSIGTASKAIPLSKVLECERVWQQEAATSDPGEA